MQDDLKNILSNAKGDLSQDQLMKYLNDELDQTERHDLEKEIANDPFEADALEGLEEVENKEKIELIVDDLNRNLKKKIAKKRLHESG
ncbi:hypothetical protein [Niabella ginsengisoli]|uniref:Uncharacterized protein n=1 Tax=Niabella ginsengisoli TaxID=522298 RepID=A0ABS9SQM7_9BACT|nr:hypothetical protein [Niabella ginsengisoli]MCH5600703.1 hypothetical protein [Niabella ginsengisoli]